MNYYKMSSGLCCCSPCRPTYKRHVDNIFPALPEDGLVKNKMETLVYYALTSPEKLDRIGEYLAQRIGRDIYRARKELVLIGMEAMDQLLSACHVRTLNLFVESFLKTIQKLLQSTDPDLQILASKSFLHFSKIEEETPSYHRTYNDFIAKFSEMCHKKDDSNCSAACVQQIRISGLQGLLGVIRKTVNEDLAENIWEPEHMDKIIPSLLFNLESPNNEDRNIDDVDRGRYTPDLGAHLDGNAHNNLTASQQADQILRELVQSASYSSINAILTPVLKYIDQHDQWIPERQNATIHTFNAIMYSIQVDLSYILIERILVHLDRVSSVTAKGNEATVLSKIIGIGVGESTVGPAVLEIINALLKQLQNSVRSPLSFEEQSSLPMQTFQNALLRSLGEYTGKMPDFQKSENMTFILSKIPNDPPGQAGEPIRFEHHLHVDVHSGKVIDSTRNVESEVQHILMKALFAVAERHSATLFSSSFNTQLMHSLLRLLLVHDADVRLLVLQTFQILADRNNNLEKLTIPTVSPANLGLNYPRSIQGRKNRSDQLFAQKSLFRIYSGFKTVLSEQSNTKEFLDAMYTTVAILAVEMSASDESTIYLLDLIDGMQTTAVQELALSTGNRFALHALAASLLALLASTTSNVPEIDAYVENLLIERNEKARHMLPPIQEDYNPGLDPNTPDDDVMIKPEIIKEALKGAGKDIEQMGSLPRYLGGGTKSPRSSWHEPPSVSSLVSRRASSVSENSSAGLDLADSACSSPGFIRKPLSEEVSVKSFKKVLEGTPKEIREEEKNRKNEMQEKFMHAMFDDLCSINETKGPDLQDYLQDVFSRLSFGEKMYGSANLALVDQAADSNTGDDNYKIMEDSEPYGKLFPQLYLY